MKKIRTLFLIQALGILCLFSQEAIAQCISGPVQLQVGQVATYTANNPAQCSNCYDWDISGQADGPNDQNQTYQFSANTPGTYSICVRTFDETGNCNPCCISVSVVTPPPPSCCFDYWAVPKYFPVCFDECTGNLDNVWEIHQNPCNPLPSGYTSAFTNVTLNNNDTFGNCMDCSNPTTTSSGPFNSFNMAVCSPYNHSVSFDISIYDANGNLVHTCPNEYYSFYVPPFCGKGDPFISSFKKENIGASSLVVYPNPVKDIVSFEAAKEIQYYAIYDLSGQLIVANKVEALGRNVVDVSNLPKGSYIYYCMYEDQSTDALEFVKID